jgi:hypothetical protein
MKSLRSELAERELEATVARETELAQNERRIRIYGFGDFGLQRIMERDDSLMRTTFPRPLSFYLGRLNLYFDARPDPDFRFLVETRFSLYPHGSSSSAFTSTQVDYTSTTVLDSASANPWAPVSWGSILLERAVLDYTRYQLFSVRAGLFLTPFGIYNVDHGSPTLISPMMPIYITLNWIPQRQAGIQIFGSYPVDRWELGYAATVANGQTDGIRDLGDGKAYGGRLFARRQGGLQLLFGASGLYRPYRRDSVQSGMTYTSTRVVERNDITLGIDQSLDYAGLRVRNELVYLKGTYTPGKRESAFPGMDYPKYPNMRQYNWYIIVAYRIWELEPYVSSDYFHCSPSSMWTKVWQPGAGINIYFRPNVMLKASWINVRFYKDNTPDYWKLNAHMFNGLLVWAF